MTIHHELYLHYCVEEAMMYARHAAAMNEAFRLYPEVLAGADPYAFWSALLWIDNFVNTTATSRSNQSGMSKEFRAFQSKYENI